MENSLIAYAYHDDIEKVFRYSFRTEENLQNTAEQLDEEIFFFMSEEELAIFKGEEIVDNLKNDFIWFKPNAQGLQIIQCTCGKFLESGHDLDKLAKKGFRHHQRTGHKINLRGN